MKRFMAYSISLLAIFILAGCDQSDSDKDSGIKPTSSSQKVKDVYSVKVDNVKVSDGDWIISGTTKAPDDVEVLAVAPKSEDSYEEMGKQNIATHVKDPDSFGEVKDGKFEISVSSSEAMGVDQYNKVGSKSFIYIAGVVDFDKTTKDEVSTSLYNKISDKGTKQNITVTQNQVDYINSIDTEIHDSESSSSETSSIEYESVDLVTFDRYFKKYIDENVQIQGTVMKIEKDDDNYILTVSDSEYNHQIAVGVSSDIMGDLGDARLEEDDTITVKGTGSDTYSSTSISGSESDVPGVNADSINIDSMQ